MAMTPSNSPPAASTASGAYWNWVTLLVALVGVGGSLWLSVNIKVGEQTLGMNLKACPLCFYQRSFVMAVAAVLAVGLLARVNRPGVLSLFVLPLVVSGLGVAFFHVNLERTNVLECPNGIFDWGTAPRQSLCIYGVLAILVVVDLVGSGVLKVHCLAAGAGIVLGAAIAYGCLNSNPPMPKADKPYPPEQKIETCRPVFKAPSE
jgi:disulfide bond formation protein DsbB